MVNTTIRVPSGTLRAVGRTLQPAKQADHRHLTVSIFIADRDISIRDLAAFLELIDRIYGRQDVNGFRSYALQEEKHVQISRLERGSWKLELVKLLGSTPSFILVLTGIILRNLPRLATAYASVQQGRLANEQRKALVRASLKEDEHLRTLNDMEMEDLSDAVTKLIEKDHDLIPRAARFAENNLLGVDFSGHDSDEMTGPEA